MMRRWRHLVGRATRACVVRRRPDVRGCVFSLSLPPCCAAAQKKSVCGGSSPLPDHLIDHTATTRSQGATDAAAAAAVT